MTELDHLEHAGGLPLLHSLPRELHNVLSDVTSDKVALFFRLDKDVKTVATQR